MKILLTGSSGALGRPLARGLQNAGHHVIGVSRMPASTGPHGDMAIPVVSWERLDPGFIIDERIDAIINLAGAPMVQRWNARNKKAILQSRLTAVRRIFDLLRQLPAEARPECMINASSVAIYSSCELPVDEFSVPGNDVAFFQACVWNEVERSINALRVPGVRTLIARFGLVIGTDERMDRMFRLARLYLGAVLGDGRQRISWISQQDLLRACLWLLTDRRLHGVFNLVSPRPTTATQLGTRIAGVVDRPALLHIPARLLRMMLGELARNFLTSADVMPARLQMAGFSWELPDLELALRAAATELGHLRPASRSGQATLAASSCQAALPDAKSSATTR